MVSTMAGLILGSTFSLLSMVFASLFVYTGMVLAKYTPVYSPISCISFASELGEQQMDDFFINMTGSSMKACRNPNNYAMTLAQAAAGQVFAKEANGTLKAIGVSSIQDVTFAAGGEDNLTAELFLSVPFMEAGELLAQDTIQLIAEFKVLASANMQYLGQTVEISQEQHQVCGFDVRVWEDEVGRAACASSMGALVVPSVDEASSGETSSSGSGSSGAQLMEMTPEQYSTQTRKKNLTFGLGLVAYFLLAVLFGACSARIFPRALTIARCKDTDDMGSARTPKFVVEDLSEATQKQEV